MKSNNGHDIVAPVMQYSDTQFVNDAQMYRLPRKQDISWKMGDDGNLYASLAYEAWRQFPMKEWDQQQEANAVLMAAAPELLEALRPFAAGYPNTDRRDYERAAEVIEKLLDLMASSKPDVTGT